MFFTLFYFKYQEISEFSLATIIMVLTPPSRYDVTVSDSVFYDSMAWAW